MSIVLALSGGLDSAVLLAKAIKISKETKGNPQKDIYPISFDYWSKHNIYERQAARELCKFYEFPPLLNVPVGGIFSSLSAQRSKSSLLQSGPDLPIGHFDDPVMRSTVVPGRNMVFAAALASIAESTGATQIWMGMHKGDWNIYPDCRPEWIGAITTAIAIQSERRIRLFVPFIEMTKREIVANGITLGVPFKLTRTCYSDGPTACGKCGACQERLEAFAANGLDDPLIYKTRELIKKG